MAFVHGSASRVAFDNLHLSCVLDSFQASFQTGMADVSSFCDSGRKYLPGLDEDTLSGSGHYDDVADANLDGTNAGGLTLVTFGPSGLAVGDPAYIGSVRQSSYAIGSTVSDRVTFAVNLQVDGQMRRGVSLHAPETETATGNGTSHDGGASSSDGLVASLHASSVTGTLDVTIQDSTDGSTWVDLGTFTQLSGAGFERLDITGTVERYLRAVWTIGTGPATFTVAAARS